MQGVVGAHWITALRAPTIQQLVAAGSIQLSLFDTQNLAEVTDPRYPGERLVVCHNPLLAEKRARKREDMLVATERELAKVAAMVERGAASGRGGLQGAAAIGERVGRVINKYQMAKHFTRSITDTSFTYVRDEESIGRRPPWTGYMCCGPMSMRSSWIQPGWCWPTRAWPTWSRPSGTSSSATWRYAPSTTTPSLECGRTSCCACWPTGYNGRCSGRWRPCSSWMRRHRRGPTRWRQHLAQRRCWRSTGPNAPPMGSPSTVPDPIGRLGHHGQESGDPHRSPRGARLRPGDRANPASSSSLGVVTATHQPFVARAIVQSSPFPI